MSKLIKAEGSCLCGNVHFNANKMNINVGACHCGTCRKWGGGGPLMSVDCGTEVSFSSEENVTIYNSSEWAERGFCKQCGTHLFYRLKHTGQYFVPTGLFENVDSFVFEHQIFIDKKPAWYCFSNKTENMTEAEVFEKYAPS